MSCQRPPDETTRVELLAVLDGHARALLVGEDRVDIDESRQRVLEGLHEEGLLDEVERRCNPSTYAVSEAGMRWLANLGAG